MTMSDFLSVLHQVCGPDAWQPRDEDDRCYRMTLLALAIACMPPHLRRYSDRLELTSCCICGFDTASSIRASHRGTCVYLLLRLPTLPHHCLRVRQYLHRVWAETKTAVALEMEFDDTHVVMAHMQQYPDGEYCHAGALVEVLLELEETKAPSWNMTELLAWIMLLPRQGQQASLQSLLHTSLSQPLPSPPPATTPVTTTQAVPPTPMTATQAATTPLPPPTASQENDHVKRQMLIDEAFKLTLPSRCKVCYRAEANALINDCGHLFICSVCAETQDKCSVCTTCITDIVKVYRS